jgi:hypothetical protein
MRWTVLLLVLLNAVLFTYFQLGVPQPVGIKPGHEDIEADKLRILSAEELASLPKKSALIPNTTPDPAQPATESTGCYEWGSFSAAGVSRVKNILAKFTLHYELRQTASQEAIRYWVYIPPLSNAEKAQAKIDEVRALGVEEVLIVQESPWRNAISLGVFKDEALANKLLDDLHARGLKSAIKGIRNHENGQASFYLKEVTEAAAAEIDKLKPDFSGSEFKKVTCQ